MKGGSARALPPFRVCMVIHESGLADVVRRCERLRYHPQAFAEGIDATIRDYAEDAVLFTPQGRSPGTRRCRSFFDGFLTSSPPELSQAMSVVRQDVEGEVAYIVWKAEPYIPLASDTFVLREGKIVVQSFMVVGAASRYPLAPGRAGEPPVSG